jgi:cytidine deaminase
MKVIATESADLKREIEEIRAYLDSENFIEACASCKQLFEQFPQSESLMLFMKEFSASLRSRCISLAYAHQDNSERYKHYENLLLELNRLTGEDIYGNQKQ